MPPESLREPRQHRARVTREAIMRAAAAEFDDRGYAAASLGAILDRTGVTKGAFYFHFSSKRDLALAIVREQAVRWRRLAEEPTTGQDPLTRLLELSDVALSLFLGSAEVRAALRLSYERSVVDAGLAVPVPVWEGIVGEQLRAAQQQGLLRAEVDPAPAARVVNDAMVGARTTTEGVSDSPGLVARVDEMWRLLLPALAVPAWLQRWRAGAWEDRARPTSG
ncbi:MAG: TetR family transcriptional regulator [Pseudonocardiaceae bacterium]|nr:TetR family transcriptional regulator [Pseudonocardiaceae bacterium]